MSKNHLESLLKQYQARDFDLSTVNSASDIIHESSHYFDHLATLSGQVLLVKVYNALNELENGTENDSIIDYLNTLRSWKHDQYAHSLTTRIKDPAFQNWSYNFGREFGVDIFDEPNSEAFMTATFKHRGIACGKVPFSIESLWETNAMWAELTYHFNLAILLKDEENRIIEGHQIQNKYTSYLYDSEMLIYSLAAHLTSNFANLGDFIRSFKLSKALSSISLNLPYCYYSQVKRTKGTCFRGITNDLLEKNHSLNPCAVFLALLENIVEAQVDLIKSDFSIDIDEILEISGLPNKATLEARILTEINQLDIDSKSAPFSDAYSLQKKNGINIFNNHGGIEGALNKHPAFFIELANKSESCVFQEDLEETNAYSRYEENGNRERSMFQVIEKLRQNKTHKSAL
ncbi:hypothetical protein ACIQY5_22195 [Peribacillus frigoritolerans]|uniref:hypothetical protein n=1 Tax=Peribacillus frigoritolerans TaxID=450367 RepID=UPI0037F78280